MAQETPKFPSLKGHPMQSPIVNAPEINTGLPWINSNKAFSLKDLKGKIIILDFWTYGCINCQHIIPDLHKLETEYRNKLLVIGIHSAKFDSEKKTESIKLAAQKFGIHHPVINDAGYKLWDAYAVKAWPTVILIAPNGKVYGQHAGEGVYKVLKPAIDSLIAGFGSEIDEKPISGWSNNSEKWEAPGATLKFPARFCASPDGNFWVSDAGHNRILKLDANGTILETIGNGSIGNTNGGFSEATFNEPQGMALYGDYLYIADTRNNLIRKANLKDHSVSTAAGSGAMGYYYDDNKWDEPVDPNSPWDLVVKGDTLFVASAGNHQVLRMDLKTDKVYRFAGNGREALLDGTFKESSFSQPSGFSLDRDRLYVADPEASAIREIDLATKTVKTIAGTGLFDFGDKDGKIAQALLQHSTGLDWHNGLLYIADTYNGKVKVLNRKTGTIKTLVSGLQEPNDVVILGEYIYTTDTNRNRIVKFKLNGQDPHGFEVVKLKGK